ncbi:DUF3575 domain-containing protein [Solirubrum puertoriconensis]|nr:DUF3575 domain-containing protein [Solirubrum puertoriconensis]
MRLSTLAATAGLSIVSLLMPTAALHAQDAPRNIIKIAPLGWIHGQEPFSVETRLGYERVISQHGSLMGSYSYLGTNYPFTFIGEAALSATIMTAFAAAGHARVVWTDVKTRTTGHRYQLQYKYYLGQRRQAPEGFYVSPHFSYTKAHYTFEAPDFAYKVGSRTVNRNYNVLFGYQAVLGRHLAVELFTGLGYRDKTEKTYDQNDNYTGTRERETPLKVSSGLNVGWAF